MTDRDSLPELAIAPAAFPPAALKQRVLSVVRERAAPTVAAQRRRSARFVAGASCIALSIFWCMGGVRVTGREPMLLLGTALGTAVIAGSCVRAALFRGTFTLGRGRTALWVLSVVAIPAILAWKVAWSSQFEGALVEWPSRPGCRCLCMSLAMAAPAVLSFAWLRRGTDPRCPALVGLAGGTAIGTLANLLADLWCPVAHVPHLVLGHALPTLLMGLFGALLGWVLIRMRHEER